MGKARSAGQSIAELNKPWGRSLQTPLGLAAQKAAPPADIANAGEDNAPLGYSSALLVIITAGQSSNKTGESEARKCKKFSKARSRPHNGADLNTGL
jgi:hypothetical protein